MGGPPLPLLPPPSLLARNKHFSVLEQTLYTKWRLSDKYTLDLVLAVTKTGEGYTFTRAHTDREPIRIVYRKNRQIYTHVYSNFLL